jgi:hypothetical protein
MKHGWLLTDCAAIALGLCVAVPAGAADLKAGAAKVSITPTADEFPYTIGREKSFVGVHDEVFARALVLDSGATRVALVSLEVESVPDAKVLVSQLARAAGVAESNLIVTATHTHESLTVFIHGANLTPIQQEEIEHIRKGAIAAVTEAVARLQPARVAFARGEAYVNINNGEQAGLKNWYDPKGPSDKTLDVVRLESVRGEALALLVDYGTHAETMYRSVSKDGGYEVSGDIPGAVSRMLEANPAGAPVALFLAAAEADQLSMLKSLQPAVGKMPEADEGSAGWGIVDELSRRLTAAVLDATDEMKPGASNITLQATAGSVTCPGGRTRLDNKTGLVSATDGPPVTIPVQTIKMGDVAIAAVAGDLGSEIGREIRTASPVPDTVVVTMLAGSVGYILPDASYRHPGHGLGGSPIKSGCAEQVLPKGIADMLSGHAK